MRPSRSRPGGRSAEALSELKSRIHDDFAYKPGATSVRTTLSELLERRKGVCQDFAHLAVGCLRSFGLAARYVSGYLETIPLQGRLAWWAATCLTLGLRCSCPTGDGWTSTRQTTVSSPIATSPMPTVATTATCRR